MAQGIMTIAEQRDGEIRKVSYEIISEARRLADSLSQNVTTILLGSGIKDKAAIPVRLPEDKQCRECETTNPPVHHAAFSQCKNCRLPH